jgi:hypothetical protein
MTKYPEPKEDDGVLLRLREDYQQTVLDVFGKLARAAGFDTWTFEKLRDRNIKWKNRKHRVPLCEGHLWVRGQRETKWPNQLCLGDGWSVQFHDVEGSA